MSAVQAFLVWLATVASQHEWLTMVIVPVGLGHPIPGLRIAYGGNFVDAYEWAQALGGWVSEVAS